MITRKPEYPAWFDDSKVVHRSDTYPHTVKLKFPTLPIVFHTIEYREQRWIPKKHEPIIVNAYAWAMRRRDRRWILEAESGIYTNKVFPHCYEDSSCLNPALVKGDIARGVWPMDTLKDYERARGRIIQLLGGINLDSLLTGLNWSFDPSLVLPDKLYHDGVLDVGISDYYAHELDWRVPIQRHEVEEEDDE